MIAATIILSCLAFVLFVYYCGRPKPKPRKPKVVFEKCSACGKEMAVEYHSDEKRRYLTCVGCGNDTTKLHPEVLQVERLRRMSCLLCGGDLEPRAIHRNDYRLRISIHGWRCNDCHSWIFTEKEVERALAAAAQYVIWNKECGQRD